MKRKIRKPISTHSHLREGSFKIGLVNRSAKVFSTVMAMLNTKDGIMTGAGAIGYRDHAHKSLEEGQSLTVIPIMIGNESTTPRMVRDAYALGVRNIKLLPYLKTTNAHYGVRNYSKLDPMMRTMEELSLVSPLSRMYLHYHPAHPSRLHGNEEEEYMFLPVFEGHHQRFPNLPKVWTHLSDYRVIPSLIDMGENVAIGVTAHHASITATEVYGINASGVFKPTAGEWEDQEAIVRLITSDFPRVLNDPDDAPHSKEAKSDPRSRCCGADTTEIVPLLHATTFQKAGKLQTEEDWQRFENFLTFNACNFFNLPEPKEYIGIEEGEHHIPLETDVNGTIVVPFLAGTTLPVCYARTV